MPKSQVSSVELNRSIITGAAIEFIEDRGLDRLTMRALANHLGCGTMSLYRHISTRDDLINSVIEEIVHRSSIPAMAAKEYENWQDMSLASLLALRDLAVDYPGSFELLALAPYDAPPVSGHIESMVQALCRTGLSNDQAYKIIGDLDAYATGFLVVWTRAHIRGMESDATTSTELKSLRSLSEFERGVKVFIRGYELALQDA